MSEQSPRRPRAEVAKAAVAPEIALAVHAPWKPAEPTKEQIGAIKALAAGTAEMHQQRIAFQFILDFSYNGGAHYFPGEGGRRDTDYALGRALLGKQMITMVKMIVTPNGEQG